MDVPEKKFYRFDRFTVDSRSACLRREGTLVPLRPKSFDVLHYLLRNVGRLVSKDELIEKVWPNVIVTENSLVQCIKDIRQALDDDGQTMLETVAKRGYLFSRSVVEVESDRIETGENQPAPAAVGPLDPASMPNAPAPVSAGAATARTRWKIAAVAAGVAVVLVVVGGLRWSGPPNARQPATQTPDPGQTDPVTRLSIAVLPFVASDRAGADDYFLTGISEEIAAALGRFSDLAVASPKLVSRFQSVGASAEDIERQLKIRYLVEGGVRRSSDRVRIAVRLTDLSRGTLLWSNTYDAPAETILAVQDEIAARIAGALAVKLTHLEQIRSARKATGSMEAYDFVLRGRQLLTRLNRTSYSQARDMFERAIALDPAYAVAYVGLGRVDLSAVALGWTPDAEEALKRAEGLARKAISLDEFSPAAHVLLGRTYVRVGEHDRAVDALKRAVALNPSDPDSYAGLGDALLWSGEAASAIAALETAISIEPRLSAEDLFSLGAAHFIDGNISDSLRIFERIRNRNEANPFIYAMLAALYAENGREAESRSAAAELRKLNPFFDVDTFGSLFKKAEHREKMASALKKAGL